MFAIHFLLVFHVLFGMFLFLVLGKFVYLVKFYNYLVYCILKCIVTIRFVLGISFTYSKILISGVL